MRSVRPALAGCLVLAGAGLLVLFLVNRPPDEPTRPYDIVVGQANADPCAGRSPSDFFFDATTHEGRYCGKGTEAGYFTDTEADVVLDGARHTPWTADPAKNRKRLFGAADGVALTKGFDAHPSSGSGGDFLREIGQITGVSLLILAGATGLFAVVRPRRTA